MIQANVTDVKNRFSHYLRLVKKGESIQILDRTVPVARLESMAGKPVATDGALDRLVQEGVVTPAKTNRTADLLKRPLVPCKVDVVKVLLEERGDR